MLLTQALWLLLSTLPGHKGSDLGQQHSHGRHRWQRLREPCEMCLWVSPYTGIVNVKPTFDTSSDLETKSWWGSAGKCAPASLAAGSHLCV